MKFIKCRSGRNDYLILRFGVMVSTGNPLYAKLTIFAELNYLLFVSTRLAKQTAQEAGWTTKVCEAFSIFLLVVENLKSILNLANRIFADLRHVRERKSRRIWKIKNASQRLLAHHLLTDNAQSVWNSAVTQRLVIQFSGTVIFGFKGTYLSKPT